MELAGAIALYEFDPPASGAYQFRRRINTLPLQQCSPLRITRGLMVFIIHGPRVLLIQIKSHRTTYRVRPPRVQVNIVRSQSPLVTSATAKGLTTSVAAIL